MYDSSLYTSYGLLPAKRTFHAKVFARQNFGMKNPYGLKPSRSDGFKSIFALTINHNL